MNTDESVIREIEKIVDNYHKNFPLFKRDRRVALIHILRVFEDACRFIIPLSNRNITPEEHEMLIHRNLDSLDIAIKWIYQCCPIETEPINLNMNPQVYKEAGYVFMKAGPYRDICDSYILWSRKREGVKIDEKKS
ncbi:MAG TPA: hypothetical protein VIK77_12840 [Tissierellaceae bacterium]